MKSVSVLLLSLIILVACDEPPEIERCVIGNAGLICVDTRVSEEPYIISFDESINYIATNPEDYEELINYCSDQAEANAKSYNILP